MAISTDDLFRSRPSTYKTMEALRETIHARMIYYEKTSNGTIVADLAEIER